MLGRLVVAVVSRFVVVVDGRLIGSVVDRLVVVVIGRLVVVVDGRLVVVVVGRLVVSVFLAGVLDGLEGDGTAEGAWGRPSSVWMDGGGPARISF